MHPIYNTSRESGGFCRRPMLPGPRVTLVLLNFRFCNPVPTGFRPLGPPVHGTIPLVEQQMQQSGDLGHMGRNIMEGERNPQKMMQVPRKPQQQLGVMGLTEGDSLMLRQLPTRRKVKHGAQELRKVKSPRMLPQGPSQPRQYEQELKRLQQKGYICPNMPNGGGSVERRLQLGIMGATGGGSVEPLPQGPPQPRQIKKEQHEQQQLGVMGLTAGGGSVEPLPQGPPQPRQIKKEQQELQRLQQQEQQNQKPGFTVPVTRPRKRTTTEAEAPILQPTTDRTAVPSH